MSEKEEQREGDLLLNSSNILITIGNVCIVSSYFYQSKLGFRICFYNCQSCKCGKLSHNYIKCDLSNPNIDCRIIAISCLSWTTSSIDILKLKLHHYSFTLQESVSSHIHTFLRPYLQKVIIGRLLNLLSNFTG